MKQGIGRAVDYAQVALSGDEGVIAKVAADQQRNALPQTALQRQMAEELAPYNEAAKNAEGFADSARAWGALGLKRAGQFMSNPAEAGKMMVEQLPNSIPGLAGGLAGAKAGAAVGTAVAPGFGTAAGAVLGGVAGGFAGGYGIEKGASVIEQVQEKAHQQGVDLQDQVAARGFVAKNLDEIDAAATRKAVGTAGTDAALNVLTMGAAGLSGRGIVNEARALAKAVDDGVVSAADATAALARLEAANAARNTVGQKALRGGAVVGAEMAGEGVSEAVGQKYAYGEVDPGQVIDEALLGLGQGGAMALGGKAFRKAAGLPDNDDAATRSLDDVHSALAKNAGLQQDGAPNDGDSGGGVDAQAGNPAFDSTNAPAPFINQGVMDVNGLGPRPPAPVLDTQRLDALLEPQRPSQAMGLRTGPDAGPLENAAALSVDTGATAQMQGAAGIVANDLQSEPQAANAMQAVNLDEVADPYERAMLQRLYDDHFADGDLESVISANAELDTSFDFGANVNQLLADAGATPQEIEDAQRGQASAQAADRPGQAQENDRSNFDAELSVAKNEGDGSGRLAGAEQGEASQQPVAQQAAAPGSQAEGANVATLAQLNRKKLAEMSDDELQQLSSLLPADHSRQQKIQKAIQTRAEQSQAAINQGVKTDGTQTNQAQQGGPQPTQAGAAQAGQPAGQITPNAAPNAGVEQAQAAPGSKYPPTDIRIGDKVVVDGEIYTVTAPIKQGRKSVGIVADRDSDTNPLAGVKQVLLKGDEAIAARLAALGQQPAQAAPDQRAKRIDEAGAQWTRMPAAERSALVGRLAGVKPVLAKNMPRAEWGNLNADIQRKLADAMGTTPARDSSANNPENKFQSAPEWWTGRSEDERRLLISVTNRLSGNAFANATTEWDSLSSEQKAFLAKEHDKYVSGDASVGSKAIAKVIVKNGGKSSAPKPNQPPTQAQQAPAATNQPPTSMQEGNDVARGQPQASTKPASEIKKGDARALFSGKAMDRTRKAVPADARAMEQFIADGKEAEFQRLLSIRQTGHDNLTDEETNRFYDLRTERNQAKAAVENAGRGQIKPKQPQSLDQQAQEAIENAADQPPVTGGANGSADNAPALTSYAPAKNEARQPLTPDSAQNTRFGDVVVDDQGQEYVVVGQRHKWLEVAPFVDGRPQISATTTLKFHLEPETAASYEGERRSDPLYTTGRNYFDELKAKEASVQSENTPEAQAENQTPTEPNALDYTPKQDAAYTLPPGSISDEWRDDQKRSPEHPDFTPTPRQQRLMDEVKKVLDGGAFYNDDVTDKVAKALGVSDEVLASNRTGVKNGDFGYDVYHARQAVQAQALEADAAKIRAELNLRAGDKLGTLIFNDFKQTNSVEVVSVTEDGRRASLKGKRGAATVTFEATVPTVKFAIERAHERGKRKDSYDEFIAGRAADKQASEQPQSQQAQAAAETVAQPITRADVEAAQQQAAAIIGERIDAMSAGDVNKIAKQFLPTMGMKPTMSKANNKAAMTDAKINLMAAAAEVGAVLPADVRRALQADMERRVVDGAQDDGITKPAAQSKQAQEGDAVARRFEIGNSLTKEQRKQVLDSLVDVYKSKGAEREFKGQDGNGNDRYGYAHSPDLFEKSDITGAMVRYYVTLPDGRIAHPTELFPDVSASDIERMALEQEANSKSEKAFENAIKPFYQDFDSANLMTIAGQVVISKGDRFAIIPNRIGAVNQARQQGWDLAKPAPADVRRALQADMEGRLVDAAKPAAPAQQEASKPKKLPPFPVDGYRLEGYYANGAKVKPLPAKAFSPTEVQAITDWFKSIGWSVTSGSGVNGVNATNDVGMTVDDLPEPYTAAQRKKDEAQKAADERAADKKNAQDDYLASNDAGKFVSDMFGDSMNRFNLTALAKVLAGDEKTFGGLFSNRAADVLADAGISTEGRQVKDIVADIKATFDAAQQDAKNPARAAADGLAAAKQEPGKRIEDFGEKLEGARKDLPPSLKEEVSDEQMVSLPLSKIWPANAHEEIQNDAAAALAFAARQAIPAKPRQSVKVQRWVQKVKNFRALVTSDDALAGNLDKLGLDGLSQRVVAGSVLEGFFAKVRLLSQLPRDTWGRVEKVGEYPDAVRYGEDGKKTPAPFSAVVIDGEAHQFDGAKSIGPDEVSKIKELLGKAAPKNGGLTEADFEIRTYKNRAESFINRKGDKEMRPLKTFTGQESGKQAREWLKANVAQAEAQWEAVKSRDNVGKGDVRTAQNRQRVGADHRKGADVTAQMFEDAFGFRGVQFGNWVAQGAGAKDRQGLLNEAYDALMDLSLLLGVPSRAMSLDGSLGLSLGARGSGKAAAHFEHDSLVINLTKTKGAGSLAHEWFHALDNYFRRQRGGMDKQAGREDAYITYKPEAAWVPKAGTRRAAAPLTSGQLRQWLQARGMYDSGKSLEENAQAANFERDPQHKDGVRPQVEAAFAQLVQALNDSPMAARATVLDGGAAKGYWGRIIERGARSFENYVINKMALQGYSNDFLANIRSFDEWQALGKNAERYPYLTPAEEGPVVEAFDNLFGTIETRQGDDGNVGLYYAANPARRPGSAQDKAVMRAIADGKNARDVLRLIANGSKDPFLRQVARLLLKAGITPNIQFGHIGKDKKGNPIHGQYRGESDTIAIAGSAEYAAERIFMHEAMHAATMRALKNGGLPKLQLQKLLEHVREQPGAAGFYGLKNVDEFVAEVFTNPDFQAALRKMSAPAGNSLKSAWHSFVRILRSILGLSNDSSSALAQALGLGVEAVRQDMVLRRQGAQATRTANAGQDGGRGVGDADPAEARRVQSAIEGKSLLDAARFLTQSSNKARAAVAQKVLEKLERLERAGVSLQLNIVHRGDMAPAAMANARGYTETGFDSKGRDIAVWLNGADVTGKVGTEEEVLLHELVHATTSGMVFYGRNQPKSLAGKHVRDLMAVTDAIASHISQRFTDADAGKATLTEFEQDMRAGANNAFRSDDEVLAWALTNSEAQQYLETIPYKSGSLWSNFVQSVRSLLGLSPANDTALSEVLRVSERLLTDDAPDAGRAAFWHKRGLPMVQQQGRGSQAFTSQRGDGDSTIDQTQTEAFRRWFAGSQVVDADGKPLRVYHGTNADFNAFDPGKLGMTTGAASASYGFFFASNPKTASYYATGNPRLDDLHRRVNAAQGSQEGGKLLKQLVDLQSDIKRQTTGQNPITQRMAEVRRQLSRYAIDISRDMTAKQERDEWGHVDQSPADERWQLIQEYKTLHEQERAAGIELGIGENGRVIPVYLSIKNPLVYDYKGRSYRDKSYAEILQQAIDGGHDGVILRNTYDSGPITHGARDETDIYVAFRPEQVKSATGNNGNFDPDDADILNFGADNFAALKASALDQISQTLSHPGKVSLWDKTVGTMRNLAERVPQFKPVFEAAQRFIDDVSMLANDAADFAPRLIPRVETWRDLFKKPITAADNKAVAKPLFEGTLMWARDLDGTPVTTEALNAKYRNLPADKKARMLLRTGKLDDRVLKMWMGMPIESYEKAVASRFDSTILKPGVVWSQKEMKEIFKLSDKQVSLYQEARAAIDRSLDMTARTDMLRLLGDEFAGMRSMVLEQESLKDAFDLVVDTLQEEARANPDMADRLMDINNSVVNRYETATELMEKGYAPLSRFGKYTVDVVDANGERQYFGMFESIREANQMAMKMRDVFNGAAVTQGTMSKQAFKLFQGITPESLEMFGSMLGLKGEGSEAQDKAFQAYLQLAKNNHSALKRLIHRKGIDGYSEDVGRVLASFVYSNARLGSQGLNAGTMETAIEGIPKEMGELRDVAMGLRNYIQDPQEEGQAVRGMLFAQYLGGSIASAFVNMTQPFQITMPWLSQYGGMGQAAKQMARALKDMGTKGFKYEEDLAKALQSAEDDGVVSPQEIHQMQAQARGTGSLRTGDGTKLGDARAAAANNWERVKVAWGQPFALAEQFNRRSTFIASYRIAKAQGMVDPAEFARRAVLETQFLFSKANKMRWGRGAIGGTLMTFKTYSVSYLELMHRMWNQGEAGSPERAAGRRAVGWAVAMLLLMGGAGGLPFMEDAEDLIDGAAQLMGYNLSTKQARKEFLADIVGKEFAEFMEQGVSGLPGAPIDVSGRLGMGNLIPGTGLFMSKQNRERDLMEIAGPAGDLVARGFTGARKALTGDIAGAALEVSPTAVRNWHKGYDMATSGIYKDTKGYKVMDVTLGEAISKFAGFQPKSVADDGKASSFKQRTKSFYIQTSADIKAQWADAVFRKDDAALERVRERLAAWNRNNPSLPITVKIPDIMKRVREMGKDREQRINDTAPKALRQQFREMSLEASR